MAKKKHFDRGPRLFEETLVPAQPGSGRLFDASYDAPPRPVMCLGQEFANDNTRLAYFTEELRKKLKDPEFRKAEGFPIGSDESILNLSDAPYYTACPNPWVGDFIKNWENEKPAHFEGQQYHREPFAADVSEGKNDPIYNAHSYHTKVPHKAIMRYILHYTRPGDIVFDGFCGTGMTGVAAQLCGDRSVVEALGYQVKPDGSIYQEESDEEGKKVWKCFSKLGARNALLSDLSPAATFIASNYNFPVSEGVFQKEAKRIIEEVEAECGWMYSTKHSDGTTNGRINYIVWSDVFICRDCSKEIVFWDEAVDVNNGVVRDSFPCPSCGAILTKRSIEHAFVSRYDNGLKVTVRQAKQMPVLMNYTIGRKRVEKRPDGNDLELAQRIATQSIPYDIPSIRLMQGQETRRNDPIGITHLHQFYTDRNLYVLAAFYSRCPRWLKWAVTGSIQRGSKQHQIAITRVGGSKAKEGGATAGHRRGTLYIPSNQIEMNVITLLSDRIKAIARALFPPRIRGIAISTASTTKSTVPKESIDYLFFDPPFGANIAYSELNSLQEGWLIPRRNFVLK